MRRVFIRFLGAIFMPKRTFRDIAEEGVSIFEGPLVSSIVFLGFIATAYFVRRNLDIVTAVHLFVMLHIIWFMFAYFVDRILVYAYGVSARFPEFYGVISYSLASSIIIYCLAISFKILKIPIPAVVISSAMTLLGIWFLWLVYLIYIATHIYYGIKPSQFFATMTMAIMTLLFVGAYAYIAFNEFFKPLIEMMKLGSTRVPKVF